MAELSPAAVVLALTSEASAAQAETLARELLLRRLVACVSVLPVRSQYWWQGRLEQSEEVQLLLKTDASRLEALQLAVHQLHSYETPEWLVWPASASLGYGSWLTAELAAGPGLPGSNPDAGPAAP